MIIGPLPPKDADRLLVGKEARLLVIVELVRQGLAHQRQGGRIVGAPLEKDCIPFHQRQLEKFLRARQQLFLIGSGSPGLGRRGEGQRHLGGGIIARHMNVGDIEGRGCFVEAVRTAILGKHVAHCQAGQREQIAERLLIFDPAEPALGRPRSRGLGLCGRRSKIWAEQDQQSHQTNQQPSQQPSTASPPAQPAARRRRLWATGE